MVVGGGGWVVLGGGWWVVGGCLGRQRVATEAISRAQMLARPPKSSPLTTPPGPLKLRLFGDKSFPKSVDTYWIYFTLTVFYNDSHGNMHLCDLFLSKEFEYAFADDKYQPSNV